MKKCGRCGELLPLEDFPRDRGRVDGRFPYCKECHRRAEAARRATWDNSQLEAHRALERRKYRTWRMTDHTSAAVIRAESMLRRYGLTPDDYVELLAAQGGTCAFAHCPRRPEDERHGRLHVDHCHVTGAVRGLLCFAHNAMLGHAADDAQALADGAVYLAAPTAQLVFSESRHAQRGLARNSVRRLVTKKGQVTPERDDTDAHIRRRIEMLRPAPPLF